MICCKQKEVSQGMGTLKMRWQYYLVQWIGAFVLASFMVGSVAEDTVSVEVNGADISVDTSGFEDVGNYGGEEYILPEGDLVYENPETEDPADIDTEIGADDAIDYSAEGADLPSEEEILAEEVGESAWDIPPPPEGEETEPTEAEAEENLLTEDDILPLDSEPNEDGIIANDTNNGIIGEEVPSDVDDAETPSDISTESAVDQYINGKWLEFSFRPKTVARGCYPADRSGLKCTASSAKNSVFAPAPAWTFSTSVPVRLYVTDAFSRMDRFKVYDSGKLLGETTKPSGSGNCGSDPVRCYNDKSASSGYYNLSAGKHAIVIVPSTNTGGAAYFRIIRTASAGVLQFSTTRYNVNENAGYATVLVTRQGGNYGTVSVWAGTSNGSAIAGKDYGLGSVRLVWGHGDTRTKAVKIRIVNDSIHEPTEYFRVNLSRPTGGATLGSWRNSVVYIYDNDKPPVPSSCHAVFTANNGRLYIPFIKIPLLDPVTGKSIGKTALFRGSLQLVEGVEDFKVIRNSMSFIKMLDKNNTCYATYSYASRQIYIPYVRVPSVMVVPPNVIVPGPTQVFQVRLQLLPLSDEVFHLIYYKYLYSIKK